MKVLITTIYRGYNYGSALQAFATQEAVKKIGHKPILLDYIPERIHFWKNLRTLCHGIVINKTIHHRYESLRGLVHLLCVEFCFGRFFKRNVTMTRPYYKKGAIYHNHIDANVYMTGSDQVWNSFHNQGLDKVFFLDFAPANAKRIAYAASFG